jgi:hypothetical protein
MKQIYFFLFLICSVVLGAQTPPEKLYPGYIVSLNGLKLTGQIGGLKPVEGRVTVIFVNDFGNQYTFSAPLIRGFAFHEKEEVQGYTTRRINGAWTFLRVVEHGPAATLYVAPQLQVSFNLYGEDYFSVSEPINNFFLETESMDLFHLRPLKFKKQLPRVFHAHAPELASKIGTLGYRFKDLEKIVAEYNEIIRSIKSKTKNI